MLLAEAQTTPEDRQAEEYGYDDVVDDEDYAVAYDAYCERELFFGKGRRTKKRDAEYLELLQTVIDEEAEKIGGRVFWDEPLREAQMG